MAKQLDENTSMGLDIDGDGKADVKISLKTIGMIIAGIVTLAGMWFTLKQDIAEAKELPVPPDPEITRMEFDMKDQLVRQTIMSTQQDVTEIKEDIKRIEEKIDNLRD